MTVFTSPESIIWGALDLPLLGIPQDWYGKSISPQPTFCLACDPCHLWFVASHRAPALVHPQAHPGVFQADLWKYDVAELFLADPVSGRYLEFNLAPNGAWWSCEFVAPLCRYQENDFPMPEVKTFADASPDGSWLTALKMPLDLLRARIDFGAKTRANVSFILQTPAQVFLSASDLGSGEPAFHRPDQFPQVVFMPLPEMGNSPLV